jgi:riboflavin synthase
VFTGLIADIGRVASVGREPDGVRLAVDSALAETLAEGDSVAVNGVCLTATEVRSPRFHADVMAQTLSTTSLGELASGGAVNLELPLRASDRLGGHVVQGHVDGLGRVVSLAAEGFATRVEIECEPDVLRYLVRRGSVAVDGVSLTVAECGEESFEVSLIPETLSRTTLGSLAPADPVNIEVDVLAKYVERLVTAVGR